MSDLLNLFSGSGPMSEMLQGYQPREGQIQMAIRVEAAIEGNQGVMIEAGTGTGKSLAYLIPALQSGLKTIVSTGTRNLQDQLFFKDVPQAAEILALQPQIALLKGRQNYLCTHRLRQYLHGGLLRNRFELDALRKVSEWQERSERGDISEHSELADQDPIWQYATSNADNCLGTECDDYQDCFVVRARREALEADLVVINHHLFFSDTVLKQEGFGELLPEAKVMIFDEAHQLPEVASLFFGANLSLRQVTQWQRDVQQAQLNEAPEQGEIFETAQLLLKHARDLRINMSRFPQRADWRQVGGAKPLQEAMQIWLETLEQAEEVFKEAAKRGRELGNCAQRLQEMHATLKLFSGSDPQRVNWYETSDNGFRLQSTPVDVAEPFQKALEPFAKSARIFTSATLATADRFDFIHQRLGLQTLDSMQVASPFDYAEQALLYLPQNLPDPSHNDFIEAFTQECLQLIRACHGHCFVLFTSYRNLNLVAMRLRQALDYPLFVQGEGQRSELLQQYREAKNPVLLGTSSFWEGIDVRGDHLRCVMIDKLPFRSPGDPLYSRRLDYCREQGGNPFVDIQLPEAILSLRQGVGRLIRDIDDTGVVMLADSRLSKKHYGKTVLKSLPDMLQTQDLSIVRAFCEERFDSLTTDD